MFIVEISSRERHEKTHRISSKHKREHQLSYQKCSSWFMILQKRNITQWREMHCNLSGLQNTRYKYCEVESIRLKNSRFKIIGICRKNSSYRKCMLLRSNMSWVKVSQSSSFIRVDLDFWIEAKCYLIRSQHMSKNIFHRTWVFKPSNNSFRVRQTSIFHSHLSPISTFFLLFRFLLMLFFFLNFSVFENREKMVLVMEFAAGGELYDYLSDRKVLTEEEARRIFRQVATAIFYCHKHKICHRDLKLENILLDEHGNAKVSRRDELHKIPWEISSVYAHWVVLTELFYPLQSSFLNY